MLTPRYIVIEGLDGAGKTGAVMSVKRCLQTHGVRECVTTREPGGTPLAEQIRRIVSAHHEEALTSKAELLLMYAARAQVVETVVKPALASGQWVISDRHAMSTLAYQGGGRQLPETMIATIHHAVLADFSPDFTLYLDIDPQVGLARVRDRGELERIEHAGLAFFQRTREKYLSLVANDPHCVLIDAAQPLTQVQASIEQALTTFFFQHE